SELVTRPYFAADFGALAAPLRDGPGAVASRLEEIRAAVPSARTTIDAELQKDAYALLVEGMHASKASAGALVVRDAASGEVLVRASGEAIDPASIDIAGYATPAITGPFGSLRDYAAR